MPTVDIHEEPEQTGYSLLYTAKVLCGRLPVRYINGETETRELADSKPISS